MSNINNHIWHADPIINDCINNDLTIDMFIKNLPDVRLDVIKEATKTALMSYKKKFDFLTDLHYDQPFKSIAEQIKNGIDETEYFKEEYLDYYITEYSLTNNEIHLLILLHDKSFYRVYDDFCKVMINLDFKVFDNNLNLITNNCYLNGVYRDKERNDDE